MATGARRFQTRRVRLGPTDPIAAAAPHCLSSLAEYGAGGEPLERKSKTIFLNDAPIGSATTWLEVARLLTKTLRRGVSVREALDHGSEGPEGFYINMER